MIAFLQDLAQWQPHKLTQWGQRVPIQHVQQIQPYRKDHLLDPYDPQGLPYPVQAGEQVSQGVQARSLAIRLP